MISITEFTVDYLTEFFKPNGFKKSGKSWYKKTEYAYIICQYQKSSFSDNFYLNFGIAFMGLLKSTKPPLKDGDWHLSGRYEQLLGDNLFMIKIEQPYNEDILKDLLGNITNNIQKFILPYLYQWSDIDYLKKNFPDNFLWDKLWLQNLKKEDLTSYLKTV